MLWINYNQLKIFSLFKFFFKCLLLYCKIKYLISVVFQALIKKKLKLVLDVFNIVSFFVLKIYQFVNQTFMDWFLLFLTEQFISKIKLL